LIRYKIILNPVAGRGAGERSARQIQALLNGYRSEGNLDFELVATHAPWHAAEIAQTAAAEGFDAVVAVGGDGTANEVINGLMRARESGSPACVLGILSVGRGNDFAFSMGIPASLEAGCSLLAQGVSRPIDIGRLVGGDYPQGRYFGNGVGIGFDAVVGFEALKLRRLSGFPSYIIAALKTIFLYSEAPLVQVSFDENNLELPALMVSIMNGRRLGGGFLMAPHGRPDDGLLDLCIAGQVNKGRIITLIPHFLRGSQATQPEIYTGRASHVTVWARRGSLPVHADGETVCVAGTSLSVEILPQPLQLICPPEKQIQ
jgi:YegS/Rv2252/BmrU family lipid kinase